MIKYKSIITFIIFAWLAMTIGVFMELYIAQGFFSRFSSITVIFAIIAEYWLLKTEMHNLYTSLQGQGAAEAGNTGIQNIDPPKSHNPLQIIAHITVITGTFMWGFGDCFFNYNICK